MNSPGKRSAFTLVEILVVIALLALVLGILTLLLTETLDVERTQAAAFERMAQHQALADQFRTDVARAEGAPDQWQEHKAGPQTLILQMKDGHHVLYTLRDGKLERHAFEGREEPAHALPIDGERVNVEFVRDGAATGLVRLRFIAVRDGKPVPGETLEIAAALGGDWR